MRGAEGRTAEEAEGPELAEEEHRRAPGPACRRCDDREQHLAALTRVHEKTADALRESQKLLRAVQPDAAGDKDWALL
jgi:hypothetical protein